MITATIEIFAVEDKEWALVSKKVRAQSEDELDDAAYAALLKHCKREGLDSRYYCWDWAK